MFETFIGKRIQKIHRLLVYDTETESTMLMEDSLIFVFDDGAVYQLHSQQAMVQLLNIVDNNFYTDWEIEEEEHLITNKENLMSFVGNLQPVKIVEFWVQYSSQEIEGFIIEGTDFTQLYILTCLGDFEIHMVDQKTFEEHWEAEDYPVLKKVVS